MKRTRHQHMMKLISEKDIKTQEQLTELLRADGFAVTQATVSRDIKELGLVKTTAQFGGYKYAVQSMPEIEDTSEQLNIFSKAVVSIDSALNQVVIKTYAGMAQAVAASLDRMMSNEIVGSIAGDDTVLLIVRTEETAMLTVSRLKKMFYKRR
ncbi:MAG: arginine repressor [Eubacteriales bacterium]|nr:arginine repressor [Eubacteriales bacterium]